MKLRAGLDTGWGAHDSQATRLSLGCGLGTAPASVSIHAAAAKEQYMNRAAIATLIALSLAACAHNPAPVEVRIQERTVEVMQPCPAEAPPRPAPIGDVPTDALAALRIVTAKLLEYVAPGGYADRAEAALAICTAPE